jgi:hypothetical protein
VPATPLTHTTYAELADAVQTTEARCLVLTGADPAFCSGDDVKQIMVAAGDQVAARLTSEPRSTPTAGTLLHTDIPVIAAVNGAAVGREMELAAASRPTSWASRPSPGTSQQSPRLTNSSPAASSTRRRRRTSVSSRASSTTTR